MKKVINKGTRFAISKTVAKIKEDANQWFFAQVLENQDLVNEQAVHISVKVKWSPPPHDWLKCNIRSSWDRFGEIGGAARVFER